MDAELETPSAIQVSDDSLLAWDHSGPLGCCRSMMGSLSQTTVIRASTYAMNTSSNHSIPTREKGHGFGWESIVVESQKFFICAKSQMGVCVIVWWDEMNKEWVAITVWGTGNVDDRSQRETIHKDGQGPQAERGYYPLRFSRIPAERGTVSAAESNWQQHWVELQEKIGVPVPHEFCHLESPYARRMCVMGSYNQIPVYLLLDEI